MLMLHGYGSYPRCTCSVGPVRCGGWGCSGEGCRGGRGAPAASELLITGGAGRIPAGRSDAALRRLCHRAAAESRAQREHCTRAMRGSHLSRPVPSRPVPCRWLLRRTPGQYISYNVDPVPVGRRDVPGYCVSSPGDEAE